MVTLLELPLEIRSLIYSASLPTRIIKISPQSCTRHTVTLHGALLPPILFQICRQMRSEAQTGFAKLEIMQSCCYGYQRLYDACVDDSSKRVLPKPRIYTYISYAHDTLYFRDLSPLGPGPWTSVLPSLDLDPARIRSLALRCWDDAPPSWYLSLRQLCSGLRLKTLTFVFLARGSQSRNVPVAGRLALDFSRAKEAPCAGNAVAFNFRTEEEELFAVRPGLPSKPLSVLIAENLGAGSCAESAVDGVAAAKEVVARVCNVADGYLFATEAYDRAEVAREVTVFRKFRLDELDGSKSRPLCKYCQIPLE